MAAKKLRHHKGLKNERFKKTCAGLSPILPHPRKVKCGIIQTVRQAQDDLSLAYTPGVAEPVREINADPANAYKYTNKGNLVAVITDGTAVFGLG